MSPGSRSIILVCRWAASRATALPKPQRAAPESSPPRSRSSTWAPRVIIQTPLAGTASASARPCTRASALAPARLTSSAISPVVAPSPWPSRPARCTTPARGPSAGNPARSSRHDSRRSGSTAVLKTPGPAAAGPSSSGVSVAASTTVWFRAARSSASLAANPPWSAARTHTPAGSATSAGPWATMTPLSGVRDGSDSSGPSTSAASKPASPRAWRHTAGLARAWCGR